jgi:arylsulfatase A-like enzyme
MSPFDGAPGLGRRVWLLWPQLHAILGLLALLITLGHLLCFSQLPDGFVELWKLGPAKRALLFAGLLAFDQAVALGASVLLVVPLALCSGAGRWPAEAAFTALRVLVALSVCLSLLMISFSHTSNLYLGSFMDLALMISVTLQIQQWFAYSHYNDPGTLYPLLAGGLAVVAALFWLLGQPRALLLGRASAPYRRIILPISRWAPHLAAATVLALAASVLSIGQLGLSRIFMTRLAPELYLTSRFLQRVPAPPDDARYSAERRQITLQEYAARVATPPRRNVIVVQVESWSATRTGFHGAPRPTTPNLDRLVRESVVFPSTLAVSTHSEYAQMAILSSLHPLKYPYHDPYRQIEYPRVMLHNVLSALGYRTAMFSSQDERWQNNINFLYNGNWDVFWFSKHFPGPHYGHGFETKILDEYTITESLKWIQQDSKRPFFLYLNLQRTHHPYEAPEPWSQIFQPSEMKQKWSFHYWPVGALPIAQNRFDNSLRYVDAQIGRLIGELKSSGLEQETILVILGDHGENVGPGAPPTHCCRLVAEEIRAPLLIHAPGLLPARVDARPVSTLDIPPTVAGLLGVPPHPIWQGVDVLALDGQEHPPIPVLVDNIVLMSALIEWPWKVTVNHSHQQIMFTNMDLDPFDQHDLSERPGLSAEMNEMFQRMLKQLKDFQACQLHFYRTEALFRNFYATCGPSRGD